VPKGEKERGESQVHDEQEKGTLPYIKLVGCYRSKWSVDGRRADWEHEREEQSPKIKPREFGKRELHVNYVGRGVGGQDLRN